MSKLKLSLVGFVAIVLLACGGQVPEDVLPAPAFTPVPPGPTATPQVIIVVVTATPSPSPIPGFQGREKGADQAQNELRRVDSPGSRDNRHTSTNYPTATCVSDTTAIPGSSSIPGATTSHNNADSNSFCSTYIPSNFNTNSYCYVIPTLPPISRPTIRLAPDPNTPPDLRHSTEKRYMLELINAFQREEVGLPRLELGNNIAAQLHAEASLANCFSSNWGVDGLKPYMRYTLAGGYQSNSTATYGNNYCVKRGEGHTRLRPINTSRLAKGQP